MLRRLFVITTFLLVIAFTFTFSAAVFAADENTTRVAFDNDTVFNAPLTWQKVSARNYDTDIDYSIIKESYKTSKGAIVFITFDKFGQAYPTEVLREAVVTAWGSDNIVSVSSSKVITLGAKQCAMITLASPGGNGAQLLKGQTPTSRAIILAPNEKKVVQFIATAPASVFQAAVEDLKAAVENGLSFATAPAVAPGKPVPPVVDQLIQAGVDAYERKGAPGQPVMIISGDKVLKALVLDPDNRSVNDTALSWRVDKEKTNVVDLLILLKGEGQLGWLLPVSNYLGNAQIRDGVARLAASTNLDWMNDGFRDFKLVIQPTK